MNHKLKDDLTAIKLAAQVAQKELFVFNPKQVDHQLKAILDLTEAMLTPEYEAQLYEQEHADPDEIPAHERGYYPDETFTHHL